MKLFAFILAIGILASPDPSESGGFSGAAQGVGGLTVLSVEGQSNAYGSAGTAAIPATRYVLNETHPFRFARLLKYGLTSWTFLRDSYLYTGYDYKATQWPYFARTWISETGTPVKIIMNGVGGTCLCTHDNDPDCVPDEDDPGCIQPYWDPAKQWGINTGSRWTGSRSTVTASGAGSSLRAVLWDQGECETDGTITTLPSGNRQADYQAAVENYADWIWSTYRVPVVLSAIPVYTSGPCENDTANRIAIRDGTVAAALAHEHISDHLVEKSDLAVQADNCSHIYDVATLGERWFEAIEASGLAY